MGENVIHRTNDQLEFAIPVENIKAQIQAIQQLMGQTMKENEHYGVIPGCVKPSLLKPGAEKLSMMFRLSPQYTITRREHGGGHVEFEVVCRLTNIRTGEVWGEGVGSCSTLETKFRYRKAEQTCPKCGKPTIIKGKKEYGGGWLCYAKKGGCGAKFQDGDKDIENQNMGRIEHDNPADYYNTVLKMGKKRAHVDAILTATAASDIFTQDIEDMVENGVIEVKQEQKINIPPPPMKQTAPPRQIVIDESPEPEPPPVENDYQEPSKTGAPIDTPTFDESTVDGLRDKIRDEAASHFSNPASFSLWLKTLTRNEEKGYRGIDSLDYSKSYNQLKFIYGSLKREIEKKKREAEERNQ